MKKVIGSIVNNYINVLLAEGARRFEKSKSAVRQIRSDT
jgi:hypothetical protein